MKAVDFNNRSWNSYRMGSKKLPRPVITKNTKESDAEGWCSEEELKGDLSHTRLGEPVSNSGIVMESGDGENVYIDTSESHTLIVGGSGSGKSRRIISESVLTLIGTTENAIIYDPKGEIRGLTQTMLMDDGFKCLSIDLRSPKSSAGWNMFSWAYDLYKKEDSDSKDKALEMISSIAAIVCPIMDMSDPYWEASAQTLIAGLGITALKDAESAEDITLHEIFRMSNRIFENEFTIDAFKDRFDGGEVEYFMMSPALHNAENTRRCIISQLRQHLSPFVMSSSLIDMLSREDVRLSDLRNGKTVIYLISPDEKTIYNSIVSIFIKTVYEYVVNESYCNGKGFIEHRLNMFLDEYGNLPRIDGMPSMLSAARSRNIRFTIALQSLRQLDAIYNKDAETIKGNCLNWMFISSRDMTTLSEISSLVGTDDQGASLITTSRLQRLDRETGEVLILRDRKKPCISHLSDISKFNLSTTTMEENKGCSIRTPHFEEEPSIEWISCEKYGPMDTDRITICMHTFMAKHGEMTPLSPKEIEDVQKLCDYMGFAGTDKDLTDIIMDIVTSMRFKDALRGLQNQGYLLGREVNDEFKNIVRPIRYRFRFMRNGGF